MQKYRDTVLDSSGNIIIGAVVTVVLAGGGAATIYSDNGLTVVSSVVSGADGSFFFYAANGRYTITVTPPVSTGLPSITVTDILLEDLTPTGTLLASQIANTPAGNIVATNVQSALNELDTEKALLAGSAAQDFAVKALTASGKITATASGIDVATSALGNCYSATYTPTITPGSNVASATALVCQYMRVGSYVHVSGACMIDPTATGTTAWELSLPVASALTAGEQLGGTVSDSTGLSSGVIYAATASDKAQFIYNATGSANQTMSFDFGYQII